VCRKGWKLTQGTGTPSSPGTASPAASASGLEHAAGEIRATQGCTGGGGEDRRPLAAVAVDQFGSGRPCSSPRLVALAITGATIAAGPSARVTVKRARFDVPPQATVIKRVICGDRDLALGGGIQAPERKARRRKDSCPLVDLSDDDPRADDDWAGHVENHGDQTLKAIVSVTCG
jgi:hypothetical protein